jgi:Cof subfamily protein (haloacid dehalogenase superfamily)
LFNKGRLNGMLILMKNPKYTNIKSPEIRMVVTDLDGTLFNDDQIVTEKNIRTLSWLGERKIIRVIATGRNLFSAKKILPAGFPVDYLVFSTGAGAVDWRTGELMYAEHLKENEVALAIETLTSAGMSFMVHDLVPDNHIFRFYDANCGNSDFKRRCKLYSKFATPLDLNSGKGHASQLLAIVTESTPVLESIKSRLNPLRVIRTTSPLDGESMWIEIFPSNVSKGHTVGWLCRRLGIQRSGTMGIGNDYNDIDLLDFVRFPFAVENAPESIKKLYLSCTSNNDSGFSDAVRQICGQE